MPPQRRRPHAQAAGQPSMSASLASLDAKLKLIAQRLKILESNEQVIGRTLVTHNKKMKDLEKSISTGGGNVDVGKLKDEVREELKAEMLARGGGEIGPPLDDSPSRRESTEIKNLKKSVDSLQQEIKELKYVIDSINPLEYITLEQLNDVIERKLEKMNKG